MAGQEETTKRVNSRQRVRLAIEHRETDRIPKGEICIEDSVIKKELDCINVGFKEKVEFINKLGLDIICLSPIYPALNRDLPGSNDFAWPHLSDWLLRSDLFTFATLDGVFGWGTRIFGFREFLTLPMQSPKDLLNFIKSVEGLNIELAKALADEGIDGLIIADDVAYEKGLLTGPEIMRRYFLPSLALQVEEMAAGGIPIFFHSDGNLNTIMTEIIQTGFKGLHCIDPNSDMDIVDLKLRVADKLCLWGNLDANDLTQSHDPVFSRKLVETTLSVASKGGFILGTTCGIFEGLDLNRLSAIYSTV